MQQQEPSHRIERYDTIVIGAGQAGLAAGYELQQRDADFLILESGTRIGESWRRRWDSLRLFTPAKYNSLPGMPFPATKSQFPSKDQVADYLECYAARFELPVRFGMRVQSLGQSGGRYLIVAGGRRFEASNVVVATGPFQEPRTPAFSADLSPQIQQLHSSEYVNPHFLRDGPVLVVGGGNSGTQIAMELARFRQVWLAGEPTGRMPRALLGRDLYDWTWPVLSRLTVEGVAGRALESRYRSGDPLIGVSESALVAAGVTRVGRMSAVNQGLPVCDAAALSPSVVIWATGFGPAYDWIQLPVFNDDGSVRHQLGVATDVTGLYFLGLRFQRTYTSALIGGVGSDAALVAEQIAGPSLTAN